ncbi:MAG: hypothetical protein EWV83_08245 [Microcystis sp. M_OC_Ca_00000000_S217Cul]|nr:MAG: hypothetical protein EWV83_08245 [Microcystis sp. M_OC_Ca_00000000_S217Cul]
MLLPTILYLIMRIRQAGIQKANKSRFIRNFLPVQPLAIKTWLITMKRQSQDSIPGNKHGSSVCVMQWTGVIRDGTLI